MLSGNCTEALSIQVNVTISCSRAKLITNGIAPLPFPLPALLIPMSVQDETQARRDLDLWRDASEAHIRSDL
jgi:hypothetical protein